LASGHVVLRLWDSPDQEGIIPTDVISLIDAEDITLGPEPTVHGLAALAQHDGHVAP
jgi:hypothetical protein